jgi:hypothetical protein
VKRKPTSAERRAFLKLGLAGALTCARAWSVRAAGTRPKLLLIHGRDQQGKDPAALKAEWLAALSQGAKKLDRKVPADLDVTFPFYGDRLDAYARSFEIPLTEDIQTKGAAVDDDFLDFQAEIAEAFRERAGVSDAQVAAEYGPNPKPRGPLNWEWVQAVLRAVDQHGKTLNQATLETFTRDVYLYTTRAGVRDAIDRIVTDTLTTDPTVVVAHSLGSVVAYSILSSDPRPLKVPLLVTVGSPLALRAIREQFRPLQHPAPVASWYNAFDKRDVVALYPLDAANFTVTPPIDNFAGVDNHTSNRHGIAGYLDDATVAKRVLDALGV